MKIVASYARKLSHALYGGNEYESSDFFCSAEGEDASHDELSKFCKDSVEKAVEREIAGLQGGLNQLEWAKVRDAYVQDGVIDPDVHEKMSKAQKWFISQFTTAKRRNAK